MSEPTIKTCSTCGAEIANDAAEGLCVACLLQQAAMESEAGTTTQVKNDSSPAIEAVVAAFPQLEILEKIGRGGMGTVFKARQPKLDRFVALKILSAELAEKPTFAERFAREGKLLARLNHPNIVAVYDFGHVEKDNGGFYFLLMEYVDGVNLRQAMREERFTPEQAFAIVPKICDALQYAHDEGVLHRDIKPENILLDVKGRVKIADFGIASVARWTAVGAAAPLAKPAPDGCWNLPEERLTQTGQILGTPSYMAPEQLDDPNKVDHRADIYALGVVFYELLTGELPKGSFAPPSGKTPVGAEIDDIVLKAMNKNRDQRYQTAVEFKTQIESATMEQQSIPRVPKQPMRSLYALGILVIGAGIYCFWMTAVFWLTPRTVSVIGDVVKVNGKVVDMTPEEARTPSTVSQISGFGLLGATVILFAVGTWMGWRQLLKIRVTPEKRGWLTGMIAALFAPCFLLWFIPWLIGVTVGIEIGAPLDQYVLGEYIGGSIAFVFSAIIIALIIWRTYRWVFPKPKTPVNSARLAWWGVGFAGFSLVLLLGIIVVQFWCFTTLRQQDFQQLQQEQKHKASIANYERSIKEQKTNLESAENEQAKRSIQFIIGRMEQERRSLDQQYETFVHQTEETRESLKTFAPLIGLLGGFAVVVGLLIGSVFGCVHLTRCRNMEQPTGVIAGWFAALTLPTVLVLALLSALTFA